MTTLFILLTWVFPVVFGAIVGIGNNRPWTGILWPLFLGWIGFIIGYWLIIAPPKRRPPSDPPESHPGYVPGLKDGE